MAFRVHRAVGALALAAGLAALLSFGASTAAAIAALIQGEEALALPGFLRWWGVNAMLAPLYAMFVAPIVALVIRQAVSRQREFLADADAALLTRDPEGLALALLKIEVARQPRLAVGEGRAHLYFVDPMDERDSWLHWVFPSHPPVKRRIELLARMGSGVEPSLPRAS
jgi:Zn-dependent protease with chaperone function